MPLYNPIGVGTIRGIPAGAAVAMPAPAATKYNPNAPSFFGRPNLKAGQPATAGGVGAAVSASGGFVPPAASIAPPGLTNYGTTRPIGWGANAMANPAPAVVTPVVTNVPSPTPTVADWSPIQTGSDVGTAASASGSTFPVPPVTSPVLAVGPGSAQFSNLGPQIRAIGALPASGPGSAQFANLSNWFRTLGTPGNPYPSWGRNFAQP